MQPRDLYDYASEMYQSLNNYHGDRFQVVARNIIGRAYYAALLLSADFLKQSTTGQNGHKNVTDALKRKNLKLGNSLDQARILRQNADYQLNITISAQQVISQLKISKAVFEYIDEQNR